MVGVRTLRLVLVLCLGGFLAGCEEDGLIRVQASASFDPPEVDFGEVPLGFVQTTTVSFQNTSLGPLGIDEVSLPAAFSIKGLGQGMELAGGHAVPLEISFVPSAEGPVSEQLVVKSEEVEISLTLKGVGIVQLIPVFDVSPLMLDFGDVELGSTANLTFAVHNIGNSNGTLTNPRLVGGSPDFQIQLPPQINIEAGIRGVFTVSFTPTRDGLIEDTLYIDVPELGQAIAVQLRGVGGVGLSRIFCQPSALVFGPVERGKVHTETLTCTARGGGVRITNVRLASDEQFNLPFAPPSVDLPADGALNVSVDFAPQGLPGSHETNLVIGYMAPDGQQKVVVPVSGEVAPPPPTDTAITVTLDWDTEYNDLDLHFLRGDAVLFSGYDTHYARPTGDWGTPRDGRDDPYLDRDDIDGLGPETLNMNAAAPGEYNVWVHYYQNRGPPKTKATVNVWLAGQWISTLEGPNLSHGASWHAFVIKWDGETGTLELPLTPPPGTAEACRCVELEGDRLTAIVPLLGVLLLFGLRRR